AESRAAQLAAADPGAATMPVDDPAHDGQPQPMPARRACAAVVEPQERGEDALPGLLRHARPVVVDHQPSLLRVEYATDLHPRYGVAHGIGHPVAQGPP